MQFETAFLPDHQILTVRLVGPGEPESIQEMIAAIVSHPEFRPGMSVLIDGSGTNYVPSAQEAATMPAVLHAQLPGSRLAVIAPTARQYSVAAVVEAVATQQHIPFATFSNRADALEWLTAGR